MNFKFYLCTLLSSLLTIANSLAINNEDIKINLNDPNAKYSKKISTGKKVSGGFSKWIIIAVIIIITIIIITCICCCLGCCACFGGSSSKKEKNENQEIPAASPVTSTPPTQPTSEYNPAYPQYGAYPPPPAQGSYPPPAQGYPPATGPQAPYGQPMYPQL